MVPFFIGGAVFMFVAYMLGMVCLWITMVVFRKRTEAQVCSGDYLKNRDYIDGYPYMIKSGKFI